MISTRMHVIPLGAKKTALYPLPKLTHVRKTLSISLNYHKTATMTPNANKLFLANLIPSLHLMSHSNRSNQRGPNPKHSTSQ
jgi:hypothetical protein